MRVQWKQQHTPLFLPGKSHGQRSLADYRPGVANSWAQLNTHTCSLKMCCTYTIDRFRRLRTETSMVVQWLSQFANVRDMGSIPGPGRF